MTTTDTAPAAPSLLRNRDYLVTAFGNTVSSIGGCMSAIAYPLLVFFLTGSVAQAGFIDGTGLVGLMIATLPGGALADRISRKAILVLAPLAQGTALAVVAFAVHAGHPPIALLAAGSGVTGLASGLLNGAAIPTLRRIVPKEQLATASAIQEGRGMVAEIIGSLAGSALFVVGRFIPFAVDAASYGAASLSALAIRTPLGPDATEGARAGVGADIREGFRFVRRSPYLTFIVIWSAFLNIIFYGFLLLLVGVVKFRGGSAYAVGIVNVIALIGGVAGSIVAPTVLKALRGRVVLHVTAWGFASAVALVAIVPRLWEIAVVMFAITVVVAPLNVVMKAYQTRMVPDRMSGRVSATVGFGISSMQWLGPIVAGSIVGLSDIRTALFIFAAALVPVALALHAARRPLAVLDRPVHEVEEIVPAVPGTDDRTSGGAAEDLQPVS